MYTYIRIEYFTNSEIELKILENSKYMSYDLLNKFMKNLNTPCSANNNCKRRMRRCDVKTVRQKIKISIFQSNIHSAASILFHSKIFENSQEKIRENRSRHFCRAFSPCLSRSVTNFPTSLSCTRSLIHDYCYIHSLDSLQVALLYKRTHKKEKKNP